LVAPNGRQNFFCRKKEEKKTSSLCLIEFSFLANKICFLKVFDPVLCWTRKCFPSLDIIILRHAFEPSLKEQS
jgi:hypothetical protein